MRWLLAVTAVLALATPVVAQRQDTTRLPTGVRLDVFYNTMRRPLVAVRPFAAPPEAAAVAEQAHAIIERDLDYSDRFVIAEVPEALKSGPITLGAWNDLGVVFLITAEVEPHGDAYVLRLALHDVPFGSLKEIQAFRVPAPSDSGFRMAIHALADELVRWMTGQPGMAASRIAFVRPRRGGGDELVVVDSDGENLERVASGDVLVSPAWAPDGKRLAYAALVGGTWQIIERNLETGASHVVVRAPAGAVSATPTYTPSGDRLVFAMLYGNASEFHEYDVARRCCMRRLTRSPSIDISPTFSPDGKQLAFNSNRIGSPQIYIMPAEGGQATLLSPYVYGESSYYTSPEWSPTGTKIAFHGKSRGGWFQIMVADAANVGAPVSQVTQEGENEDPSWAPDGRHLVYTSVRASGQGVYVVDTFTGRERRVTSQAGAKVPAWSPALRRAAELALAGR